MVVLRARFCGARASISRLRVWAGAIRTPAAWGTVYAANTVGAIVARWSLAADHCVDRHPACAARHYRICSIELRVRADPGVHGRGKLRFTQNSAIWAVTILLVGGLMRLGRAHPADAGCLRPLHGDGLGQSREFLYVGGG